MMSGKPGRRHGSAVLERIGWCVMAVGAALVLVPAFPADGLASVHELLEMTQWALWQKFAGCAALMVGNTLRLIGVQGHPGLPWPGRLPEELVARIALRRRAFENRARALAGR
jgi:hypothetical protein